ncbi:MAG: amino acid ABC transporter ATP-binding protein, partial [Clostridia bacterium]|nr:amino acid ABC transporter ATP-binding protein [Clostridia bacterium]
MIAVKDLRKNFEGLEVLRGVDLQVEKGECVVFIGPSGSGKSTFLRCLNLLETPTSGEILFDGVSMTDTATNIDQMRQRMGMVFQHFNLFPNMTILNNLTLAPIRTKHLTRSQAEEKAMELLKRVGLEDKAASYP